MRIFFGFFLEKQKFSFQKNKKYWKRTICFNYVGKGITLRKEVHIAKNSKFLSKKPLVFAV